MYSFLNFEPVHCSTTISNCCFLTCIQISQEAGQVVWYSHLLGIFHSLPQVSILFNRKSLITSRWPALHNTFTVWMQPHLSLSAFPLGPRGTGCWLSKPCTLALFLLVLLHLTHSFVISIPEYKCSFIFNLS